VGTVSVGGNPTAIGLNPRTGASGFVLNSGSGTVTSIGLPTAVPPLAMAFDFNPNTLNLKSMGRWVSGVIQPTTPTTPADIVVGSILLNGTVAVDPAGPVTIGDANGDGMPDLSVKFLRQAVSLILPDGDHVPVSVSGQAGTHTFTGVDSIRVTRAPVTSPHNGEVLNGGQAYTVRWDVPHGVNAPSVALLESDDQGMSWALVKKDLPNSGSCLWNVDLATTDSAEVAIVQIQSADQTGYVVDGVLGVSPPFHVITTTDVEAVPTTLSLAAARPNPARQLAHIRFGLPQGAPVSLDIFEVNGRHVCSLVRGPCQAGWHDVVWDGRDDAGGRRGAGLYFIRMFAQGRSFRERMVWLP
jgi:hypothetical protein